MRIRVIGPILGVLLLLGTACASASSSYSRIPPDTMGIWAVGDSFAAGLGPDAPGWGEAVEDVLGVPVATFGLGGATYADLYLWLQQQVQLFGYPTQLVVMAGANDLNSDVPLSYMQQNAAAISALMIGRNVDVRFVTIPPAHPNSSWARNDDDRVAFNNWLIGSSMPEIECSSVLQDGQWIRDEYVYSGDWSHLSPAGTAVYAQCIAAAL